MKLSNINLDGCEVVWFWGDYVLYGWNENIGYVVWWLEELWCLRTKCAEQSVRCIVVWRLKK